MRLVPAVLTIVFVASLAATIPSVVLAAEVPADRVIALYFHRTERCDTCQTMGKYAEEAVKKGFAKEVKAGTVAFYYIDYQNRKNAAIKKGYKVTDPALIVAKIVAGKVKEFKDLEEIWDKVDDKEAFLKYVRENVTAYRK